MSKEEISDWFKSLQDSICEEVREWEGKDIFTQDLWFREGGGGGRSRAIQGEIIEKGGVNYSAVHGEMPSKIAHAIGLEPNEFYATGVSIVMHPVNPYVPIIHMNVRYFETDKGDWWFGGGIDLTPHYINVDEANVFHQKLSDVCQVFDGKTKGEKYAEYKQWADNYFYLKHRKETRGVGGIFFDRLNEKSFGAQNKCFQFVQSVGQAFVPIYKELVLNNKDRSYSAEAKEWQYLRRSRYVEFNLVWDRGTKFGLDTDGRTESILMSMPPMAKWEYNHIPEPGSEEAKTIGYLKKGIDWLNYK